MQRCALLACLTLAALWTSSFGQFLISTNPAVVTDLARTNLQARALKYNPFAHQLIVLSSNNAVSFLTPETLALERETSLPYAATDLAVSDEGSLLFVTSDNDRTVYTHHLSDFRQLPAIPITNGVPGMIESLPGGTNAFVVTVLIQPNAFHANAFIEGQKIFEGYSTNWMLRTSTNVIFFRDHFQSSESFGLRMDDSGNLVQTNMGVSGGTFRPSGFTSVALEDSIIYSFSGNSQISAQANDIALGWPRRPPLTLQLPGPPQDLARWGSDGFAFISRGVVTTFRSTLAPKTPAADLALQLTGLSAVSDFDSVSTLSVMNRGPGVATDIRIVLNNGGYSLFTRIQSPKQSVGALKLLNGVGFNWHIPQLNAGQTATMTFTNKNVGAGTGDFRATAAHAEQDPTRSDTIQEVPYQVRLDPGNPEYLKAVAGGVWGGGPPGAVYIPYIDRALGMYRNVLSGLNLKTGLLEEHATVDFGRVYLFSNNEDESTFLAVDQSFYRLYAAADMRVVWDFPRDWTSVIEDVAYAALVFTRPDSTNIVVSFEEPQYPPRTNVLRLIRNGERITNSIEGGSQLIQSAADTLLSYIAPRKVLQLVRINSDGFSVLGSWTNLISGTEVALSDGILYSADGKTFSFPGMQPGGDFSGIQNPESVRVYPQLDRAVFVMRGAVNIYELSTKTMLGSYTSTLFQWNYPHVPRHMDFSPPDTLFFSSTSNPIILRTPLLRGLELVMRHASKDALDVTFFARRGKSYSLESSAAVSGSEWITETEMNGEDATVSQNFLITGAARYFRIIQR